VRVAQIPALLGEQRQAARSLCKQNARLHNVTAMVKRRCAAAGLAVSFSSHSFRTTGATLFVQNGGDLPMLQELLGHADVRTTRVYVRAATKGRRQEVERVHL
jgi:integrase/recombinase XerD